MQDETIPASEPATRNKGGRPRKVVATAAPVADAGITAAFSGLIEELKQARMEQPKAQAEAFAKIQNPSNIVASGRSAFNPRGDKLGDAYQMPRLKCEFHAPWKIHPEYHGLDREEVELFNLLEPGEYRVELVDGSQTLVRVIQAKNDATGKVERMRIETGWTEEHQGKYPAMRVMLREMIGAPAQAVMTIKQEHALIARGDLTVSV